MIKSHTYNPFIAIKTLVIMSCRESNRDKMVSFHLSAFLRSPRSELDLLRKLADVLIVNLFPRSYVDCFLLRHALRELIACKGWILKFILTS